MKLTNTGLAGIAFAAARGLANGAGDDAADREVGARGRPGPDPEEGDLLRIEGGPAQSGESDKARNRDHPGPSTQARKKAHGLHGGTHVLCPFGPYPRPASATSLLGDVMI